MKNNNVYTYKAKCGLDVTFIRKPGFTTKYASIGTKYGSCIREFIDDDKLIKTKSGLAHFLEHKLFRMPDGSDALESFTELHASANAFTKSEKTVYYFVTINEFFEPLRLLLNMYFTPAFEDSDIEREKPIIISEANETYDNIDNQEYYQELESLYPGDYLSVPVIGTIEDIKSTTKEDLYEVYNAFYTPLNSKLLILADEEPDKIFEEVENTLSKLTFSNKQVEVISNVKSNDVLPPREFKTYPEAIHILGRIDGLTYNDIDSVDAISTIFKSLFTHLSPFYKKLVDEELILNEDLDYTVQSNRFSFLYSVDFYSDKPDIVIPMIIEKIKNLEYSDLNPKVLEIAKKKIKARQVLLLDQVGKLGYNFMDIYLEDQRYNDLFTDINEDILKRYLPMLNDSKITYIISK